MPLECIRRVLIDDLDGAELTRGLVLLHGSLNGETVVFAFSPNTAIAGINSVRRALFGRAMPWPSHDEDLAEAH